LSGFVALASFKTSSALALLFAYNINVYVSKFSPISSSATSSYQKLVSSFCHSGDSCRGSGNTYELLQPFGCRAKWAVAFLFSVVWALFYGNHPVTKNI
jgi:hypothetical protein